MEACPQRAYGSGSASLHMQAEAIDIRLAGIPTSAVRDAALRPCVAGELVIIAVLISCTWTWARAPVVVNSHQGYG